MLSRGDMVKDYEIIAPLRSGGMALVYLARRRGVGGFNRLVVLKIVHPELAESERITALFLAEARMCAQIAHPNVVHVEEIGELDGRYFLAMEYVHGASLAELLTVLSERRMRMDTRLCVWIVAQLAEALHAVHEARSENDLPLRIVHSDVSPQNVLIGHTGHVKLIDFGIAKSRHDSSDPDAALLGKLGYMAPEQLTLGPIDRRTDVYALGVMLWELLTARSLFRCQRIDDERDWATRENPPLVSAFSPVSEALDRVVRRALEPKADDRYSSALAFRAALLRAAPEALQVDAPRLAPFIHSLIGDDLKRQRESWPLDVSVQLELDSTVDPLGNSDPTVKIMCGGGEEEDTTTRVRDALLLIDDEPAVDDEDTRVEDRPLLPLALCATEFCAVDEESNTEVALTSPRLYEPWPGPPPVITLAPYRPLMRPSIEAQIVTVSTSPSIVPPLRSWHRSLRGRGAGLLSLGVLCLAFGVVLAVRTQSEPVGTIRRVSSPAFRAPAAQFTAGQPEAGLRAQRPHALKRRSADAGLQASAQRPPKRVAFKQPSLKQPTKPALKLKQAGRAKLSAHPRRAKR